MSLAVAAALAAAELLLRLFGLPAPAPPIFSGRELTAHGAEADPELFWVLRRDVANGTVNRFQLGGYDPAPVKGARDLRVLCLGESVVSGLRVGFDRSFGMLLERRLQAALPNARVETVLGGLAGWSVVQVRRLLETRLRDFAPDVTIVHVGAWNDQFPAGRCPDVELGALAPPSRCRCWQLLRRLGWWFGPPAAEVRDPASAPYGRRVPLEQFRDELERLVTVARAAGGSVVFVLPALRPDSRGANPVSADYRRVQQEVAAVHAVPLVDAVALCDRHEQSWGGVRQHSGLDLYADALHLGLAGHELLAQALYAAIAAAPPPRWAALAAVTTATDLPVVRAVAPAAVPAIAGGSVLVAGDFDGRCAVDRVWIGDRMAPSCAREGAGLRVVLPLILVPGGQRLELVTGSGAVLCPSPLQVLAPALQVDASGRGDEVEVVLQAALPPRCEVVVLASRFLLPEPLATALGPLYLAEDQRRPVCTPPLFGALRLAQMTFFSGDGGSWRAAVLLPRGTVPGRTFLQLMLVAPGGDLGMLSAPSTVLRPL